MPMLFLCRSSLRVKTARWIMRELFPKKMKPQFTICCLLLVSLFILATGCKMNRRSAEHAEVTGTVKYNGKPLPGGQIKFIGEDWAGPEGIIDEQGQYRINPPVGKVTITVDNRMLRTGIRKEASKGAGPRPGGPEPSPIKGKFVKIPEKYFDPANSGLTYIVKSGPQTHDIELSD